MPQRMARQMMPTHGLSSLIEPDLEVSSLAGIYLNKTKKNVNHKILSIKVKLMTFCHMYIFFCFVWRLFIYYRCLIEWCLVYEYHVNYFQCNIRWNLFFHIVIHLLWVFINLKHRDRARGKQKSRKWNEMMMINPTW